MGFQFWQKNIFGISVSTPKIFFNLAFILYSHIECKICIYLFYFFIVETCGVVLKHIVHVSIFEKRSFGPDHHQPCWNTQKWVKCQENIKENIACLNINTYRGKYSLSRTMPILNWFLSVHAVGSMTLTLLGYVIFTINVQL